LEQIVPLNTDIAPDAGVSGAIVRATEYATLLSFNARRLQDDGKYHDAGRAVVRFERCTISKFGYPNDEAWWKIPRTRGLTYGCYEVLNSGWNNEILELNRHSFPKSILRERRHFLFLFHDTSFECLADDCSIEAAPTGFEEFMARTRSFFAPEFDTA
jgi:hypothetical protein